MNVIRLIGSIALCQLAGIIGSIFTTQSVRTWYPTLTKPSFSPPNWLFAPAWITLYTMMGIALYLVWQKSETTEVSKLTFAMFFVQLILNALWSFIFFGLRSPFWGFVEIMVLWVTIAISLLLFWRVSITAGVLLIPYLLWVSFAATLTFSIWRLNQGAT
jgi:translocator protein